MLDPDAVRVEIVGCLAGAPQVTNLPSHDPELDALTFCLEIGGWYGNPLRRVHCVDVDGFTISFRHDDRVKLTGEFHRRNILVDGELHEVEELVVDKAELLWNDREVKP